MPIAPNTNHIFRCPHDQENPYFLVNRDMAKNKTISFRARGFLQYLLSFDKSWSFSLPWIARDQGESEEMINKMFKELMEAGYAHREVYNDEKGYRKWRTFISEYPKFKKTVPHPVLPDAALPDAASAGANNKQENPYQDSKEIQICKERSPKAPPSAEAAELCTYLLTKIKERLPASKTPNMKKWAEEMDKLLRIDKHTAVEVEEAIDAMQHDLWLRANVLSPKSLRSHFARIQSLSLLSQEKNLIKRNRNYVLNLKKEYPERLKDLTFDDKFVMNRSIGKELPLSLPHESFKREVVCLFGGRINE